MTVTERSPIPIDVQDSTAFAGEGGKITLETIVHVRPTGAEAETERDTVPAKPLSPVRVIVEVAGEPPRTWEGETALADIVKSVPVPTVNVTAAWCTSEPIVAVTITV